jgi:hypothetical protein
MSADTENVDSELQSSLRESHQAVFVTRSGMLVQRWPVAQTPVQLSARQRPVPNEKRAAWPAINCKRRHLEATVSSRRVLKPVPQGGIFDEFVNRSTDQMCGAFRSCA